MRSAVRWAAGVAALGLVLAPVARAALYSERLFHYPRPRAQWPAELPPAQAAHFTTSDGLGLSGWFVPPRNGATVVLVHGLGQGRQGLLPEARVLLEAGYGVLLFDLRAHGESAGEATTWGNEERRDVEAALAWVRAQPQVDPARVGGLGFSIGASALADVAARDAGLGAVALVSPYTLLSDEVDFDCGHRDPLSRLGMRLPFWRRHIDLAAVRTVDALHALAPRPVWLVVGALERDTEMNAALLAAAPSGASWRVPGAGHGHLVEAAPAEYPRRLRAFFDAALQPHHP
ncbi:alpha/beta fold hydrolase [Aggregicoccus sp. 17bor-14]|uniref:alpha/beta hydrolase n=1 Tax=Myxococcaceae TaxID=31 RepID=UPI00129D1998|nr:MULTISPECIES: alpha/beta fold hydrolase [Myxococcaceae]MBF5043665.1 alpha/beta hydrolase [Simulacricoccus sp. 17bor-14]MRI89423.1 alpha/beta fold hydrolase [Aggregicoccus sp. 17bor-14]